MKVKWVVPLLLFAVAACAIVTVQVGPANEHDSAAMMVKPTIDRTTNETPPSSPPKEKE